MNNRGFTLVEVIMVMALMAIMLIIAAPSFVSWRESAQYKEVARDVLSGLREARSIAVVNNQTVDATIDIDNHQLVYGTVTKQLDDSVTLETRVSTADSWSTANGGDTTNRSTTFNANGSCSGELYVRVNSDNDLVISIASAATGLSRMP